MDISTEAAGKGELHGGCKRGEFGVHTMLKKLQDAQLEKRLKATEALLRLPQKTLLQHLDTFLNLLDKHDAFTRRTMLRLLGKMNTHALAPVLDRVLPCLRDEMDGDARRAALDVLHKAGPDALARHADLLASLAAGGMGGWPVRITGLFAFVQLPAPILASHMDRVMTACLHDPEADVRFAALQALRSLTKERQQLAARCAHHVVERCFDEEKENRWAAVDVLSKLHGHDWSVAGAGVLARVIQALDAAQEGTREAAVKTLCRSDPVLLTPAVMTALVRRLGDGDAGVRWTCVHGLSKLPQSIVEPHIAAIEERTRDQDVYVRSCAVRLLEKFPDVLEGGKKDAAAMQIAPAASMDESVH